MLRLDLPRLEREGSASFEGTIAPDDPLWEGSDLRFDGDAVVRGRATVSGTGEIVVRLEVEGTRVAECRRCLEPVRTPLKKEAIFVFAEPDESGAVEGSDLRPLAADVLTLDLGDVLREELILSTERWVECREDCAGLCPLCGVNLNEQTCDCSPVEADPRWDALRALKSE
jgi:uncharacterized metal-binding protein YceD (DUF177 family)